MWYNMIKGYFDRGFYTEEQIKIFVKARYITEEEFKEITGSDYTI